MDFDLRQWLLILGPIFIVGVLLHGYFRMRSGQNEIKMKLDRSFMSQPGEDHDVNDLSLFKAELPNGGARVIGTGEAGQTTARVSVHTGISATRDDPVRDLVRDPVRKVQGDLSESKHESVRDELSVQGSSQDEGYSSAAEGALYAEGSLHAEGSTQNPDSDVPVLMESVDVPPASASSIDDGAPARGASMSAAPAKAPPARRSATQEAEQQTTQQTTRKTAQQNTQKPADKVADSQQKPEKFVVIYVLALDDPFPGQTLVEILVDGGMTFGEMDIFHSLDEKGDQLFSLASAVEPGTFDMSSIDQFSTPGVTLFMRVHELTEPLTVLDSMLAVAETIARDLNGEVRDETRSVMTPQTVEYCRQSITEYLFRHPA